MVDFSKLNIHQSLGELASTPQGLNSRDAHSRLKKYGPNKVITNNKWGWLKTVLEPFLNPFAAILLVAAALSVATGSSKDATVIIVVLVLNAFIEYSQRISSGRVLKSLRKYDQSTVSVRRDNKLLTINAEELVPGDVAILHSGEKVPADGRLLKASGLLVSEAALTGESLPINKHTEPIPAETKIYQKANMVFKGSYIVEGEAEFLVTATASQTQFGQIASLTVNNSEATPIAKKIAKLIQILIFVSLLSGVVIFIISVIGGRDLLETLRFCIALVVSVIPEGLPLTLTVVMLAGVAAMARRKVLVRKLAAVETLGMITAIATDKTGTLTEDKLSVADVWPNPSLSTKQFNEQLLLSVGKGSAVQQYSIEHQILQYAQKQKVSRGGWRQLEYLPFVQKKRISSVLWERSGHKARFIKGAPESVLKQCKIGRGLEREIKSALNHMLQSGMRVVAVAGSTASQTELTFVGLIGFSDKVRSSAKSAVMAARNAGIEIYMLTGDNAQTAKAVADTVGIATSSEELLDGAWAAKQSTTTLAAKLKYSHIFGRVLPEYKHKILEALKLNHITAMTGDGVNDAPALVKADVGIAMGSGTEVAKDAADIVLLDNNFSVIVEAIAQGRRIYANIRKMLIYILCSNFSQTLVIIAALLLNLPIPFTAIMVLISNLITDTPMILALGVEPAHSDQMQQPPRPAADPVLKKPDYIRIICQSVVMASIVLGIYCFVLQFESEATARVVSFFSLIAVQWSNAFNSRSHRSIIFGRLQQNPFLWLTVGLGLVAAILLIVTPLGDFLQITGVSWQLLVLPPLGAGVNIVFSELYKFLFAFLKRIESKI